MKFLLHKPSIKVNVKKTKAQLYPREKHINFHSRKELLVIVKNMHDVIDSNLGTIDDGKS